MFGLVASVLISSLLSAAPVANDPLQKKSKIDPNKEICKSPTEN